MKYEMTLPEIILFLKEKGYNFSCSSLLPCCLESNFITKTDKVADNGGKVWSFDFDTFLRYIKSTEAPKDYISLVEASEKFGFSLQYLHYRQKKGDFKVKKFGVGSDMLMYAKKSDIEKLSKRSYVHSNGKGDEESGKSK